MIAYFCTIDNNIKQKGDCMMKKTTLMMALVAITMLFTACDNEPDWPGGRQGWTINPDDNNGGNNGGDTGYDSQLNSYEQALVGSYVSDDDQAVVYIVLNNDRSGYITTNNATSNFIWRATSNQLVVVYDGDNQENAMEYYYSDSHLYIDGIPLVTNTSGSGTETTTSPLIGQWEGTIADYYLTMYPNLDASGSYATIMEFTANGDGAQLDYDETNPQGNYSYMPFQWMSNGTAIIVYYGEDEHGNSIPTATISNYALTSTKFTGKVAYGLEAYSFKFAKTSGFSWSSYQRVKASRNKTPAKSLLKELMADKSKATTQGSFKK